MCALCVHYVCHRGEWVCRGDMIELERVFRACESCHTSRIQCTQRQTEEQVYRGTCTCTYPIVRFTPNAAHGLIAEQYNTIKFYILQYNTIQYNTIHYISIHIHTYPYNQTPPPKAIPPVTYLWSNVAYFLQHRIFNG